jgi:hypothetical protein
VRFAMAQEVSTDLLRTQRADTWQERQPQGNPSAGAN